MDQGYWFGDDLMFEIVLGLVGRFEQSCVVGLYCFGLGECQCLEVFVFERDGYYLGRVVDFIGVGE